jgi:Tfp pilus assembly PilM family ATPase/Tfp pilus assembly protein PilN
LSTNTPRGAASAANGIVAGIDLGHERTRVVCLDMARGPGTVVGWTDEPTPSGLFFSGRLQRVVEAGAWLRKALAATGAPRPSSVVMAVAPADAQVRRVNVPSVGERTDVLRALRSHTQFRGTDALEWRFDFQVLDVAEGQVLAVAGTCDGIGLVQALARAASLPHPVVSASEVGLVNAWRRSAGEEIASRRLLLEGGHSGVTLALVEGGVPLAFRRVLLPGRELQRETGGGDVARAVAREWAARISSETRILVGAVVRDGGATPPVSIAGGLASSLALREALQDARGAPVIPMEVFGSVEVAVEAPAPEEAAGLAVAFGLAAGGAVRAEPHAGESGPIHVNLYADGPVSAARVHDSPRAVGIALYRDPRVRGAAVAAVLLALALLGADAALSRRVRAAEADLERARRDSAAVAADLARVRQLEAERARLGGDAGAILALDRARDAWPRFMDRVASVLPRYVWLGGRQEMKDLDPRTGAFAFVLRGFAGSTEQIAVFERALRGGSVSDAVVTSTARVDLAGIGAIRWEMRGRVALPPDPLDLVPLEADVGYRGSGQDTPAPTITESGVH